MYSGSYHTINIASGHSRPVGYPANPIQPLMSGGAGYMPPQYYGGSQLPLSTMGGYGYGSAPLQNYFSSVAGIDQQLDRQEFDYVARQMYPQSAAANPYQQQQLNDIQFMAMDTNRDGRIDYNEFASAMGSLRR